MPPTNQKPQVATKEQRPVVRRWFRLPRPWRLALLLAILTVLVWQRQLWWPLPFEALARRELAQRRPEAALKWLTYVDAVVRRDPECELLRARAYRRLGEMQHVEQALRAAKQAGAADVQIEREQILAMAQSGQLRQSEPRLPRLLTDVRGDNKEVCEAFVIGYIRTQQLVHASRLLDTWISDSPDDPQPYFLRGQVSAIKGDTGVAQKDVRRALELAPARHDIRLELADIFQIEHRPEEAAALYEQCLNDPDLGVRAKVGLASCKKALGDSARALELLKAAVLERPEDPDAIRELGRLEFETGAYDEAVPHLQAAVDRTPYHDECHYLLAQALQLAGRSKEAASHFEYVREARAALTELNALKDTLRKIPKDVQALVRAGELMLRYDAPEEGVVQLMAALDIEPGNPKALQLLADHYRRRAESDSSFRDLAERFQGRLDAAN
jgi:tetratricopeptide (TPR) repeat protein